VNTYTHTFVAECPNNGERITYTLSITKATQLMVEDIKAAAAEHSKGYHEAIAHALWVKLGGQLVLDAIHDGVHIRTVLPEIQPWIKPSEQKAQKTPEQIAKEDREWADYAAGILNG